MSEHYITSFLQFESKKIPQISTELTSTDVLGTFWARLTFNRDNYRVKPGLYAVGTPHSGSLVFASANYKMSFDILRNNLRGMDAWIMVLDTKGVNVWCAAGKGTFGTGQLLKQIKNNELEKVVSHRRIIVPQLGATGIAAHEVKKRSGFNVMYGPVRAKDIPEFISNNFQATAQMRRVKFSFYDRLVLVPAEVILAGKYMFWILISFFVLSGVSPKGYSTLLMLYQGRLSVLNLLTGYIAGTIVGPLFLPWLPGKSFALKGFFAGIITMIFAIYLGFIVDHGLELLGWGFLISALASFLTMNFTGSSTYTSLSGVKKEMRVAVPLQLASVVIGCCIWIFSRFS